MSALAWSLATGSSPRVRGAAIGERAPRDDAGIIPARAGSSQYTGTPVVAVRDHPRACGEQS